MICSMTAFGRARRESAGYAVTVEIRALNSRALDVVVRMPKNYLELEEALRKQVAGSARRGRLEVFVQIDSTDPKQKAPQLNLPLARLYWEQLQQLHRQLPGIDAPKMQHLLQIPYLFEAQEKVEDQELVQDLLKDALSEALQQTHRMRCREGEALLRDCMERLTILGREIEKIESRKDVVLQEYQKRLRERMDELLGNVEVDEARLLQEIACLAERSDINEEMVRLQSHIAQMQTLLEGAKAADGRRLDFLTQELHREANTIGCKSTDLEIAQAVVRMKSEIGKLKEQVQNIE